MDDFTFPEFLPVLIIGGVFLFFLYRFFKFGGLRGIILGARVEKDLGSIQAQGKLVWTTFRVSVLDGPKDGKAIGLDMTTKTFSSWHQMPYALSVESAEELAELLKKAAAEKRNRLT